MAQSGSRGGGWVWDGRQWVRLQKPSLGQRAAFVLFTTAGWAVAALVLLVGVLHLHPHLPGSGTAAASAAATLPPGAKPQPSYGPSSSGGIRSVAIKPDGTCFVGGKCGVEVTVAFPVLGNPVEFTWTYRIFDPCTGTVTDGPTDRVTADAGWNHLVMARTLTLPKAKSGVSIVAVTLSPQLVASQPYQVGSVKCQ